MPKLKAKNGEWELPFVHEWDARTRDILVTPAPLIEPSTRIFMVGTCLAVWMTAALRRFGFKTVNTHPDGHLMNTRSIRQAISATFGAWPSQAQEPIWKIAAGHVDPFAKSYHEIVADDAEVMRRRSVRQAKADKLVRECEIAVIVPEYADTWMSKATGNTFINIPVSEVFDPSIHVRHRLTVDEMKSDLRATIAHLRTLPNGGPAIILATGGFTDFASMSGEDVRVASFASMSRTRAAISELCEEDTSLHYFAIADNFRTAVRPLEFVEDDGRHLHQPAIDYFASELVRQFAKPGVVPPEVDRSWLSGPGEARAAPPVPPVRPDTASRAERLRGDLYRSLRRGIPMRYLPGPLRRLIDLV